MTEVDIEQAQREHWAFRAPKASPPPPCTPKATCRSPIDAFVLAKLRKNGLKPAAPADRPTLIRRATFDLIGLPPTPAEVDAFVRDRAPDAFAKVLDRLLASPQYGERWGRHWLDVARYADSRPSAFLYRDWVIAALNEDMPYDQFLVRQIAGDKLADADALASVPTGLLTLGREGPKEEVVDDRIDVVTRGTLGLTVSCARCHDHRYDPIPTKDYYSLYGVFAGISQRKGAPVDGLASRTPTTVADYERAVARRKAEVEAFRAERGAAMRDPKLVTESLLAGLEARGLDAAGRAAVLARRPLLSRLMLDRWATHLDKACKGQDPAGVFAALCSAPANVLPAVAKSTAENLCRPDPPSALGALHRGPLAVLDLSVADIRELAGEGRRLLREVERPLTDLQYFHPGAPIDVAALAEPRVPVAPRVFRRGNPRRLGEEVPRQFLAVLSGKDRRPFEDGSGRMELATAIASADNPLTARVMVNRVWLHHFGAGLVRTPSDFGVRGEPPTHPELLDWLARSFVAKGWSLKQLHRTIMLSATYQRSSRMGAGETAADPENLYLGRMSRRRLDFEAMHDAVAAVSGGLDLTQGGRPIPWTAHTSSEVAAGERFVRRRAVYLFVDRKDLAPTLRDFDFPSPDGHSPQRFFTTVPQQALFMLNNPFALGAARALAARGEVSGEPDPRRRIGVLYRIVLGREPTRQEVTLGLGYVASEDPSATLSPWAKYAQVLLLGNELMFVD